MSLINAQSRSFRTVIIYGWNVRISNGFVLFELPATMACLHIKCFDDSTTVKFTDTNHSWRDKIKRRLSDPDQPGMSGISPIYAGVLRRVVGVLPEFYRWPLWSSWGHPTRMCAFLAAMCAVHKRFNASRPRPIPLTGQGRQLTTRHDRRTHPLKGRHAQNTFCKQLEISWNIL